MDLELVRVQSRRISGQRRPDEDGPKKLPAKHLAVGAWNWRDVFVIKNNTFCHKVTGITTFPFLAEFYRAERNPLKDVDEEDCGWEDTGAVVDRCVVNEDTGKVKFIVFDLPVSIMYFVIPGTDDIFLIYGPAQH